MGTRMGQRAWQGGFLNLLYKTLFSLFLFLGKRKEENPFYNINLKTLPALPLAFLINLYYIRQLL
jgi:hypothetical protein